MQAYIIYFFYSVVAWPGAEMCLKLRHGILMFSKALEPHILEEEENCFGQNVFQGLLFYFFVCKYGTITIRGFFP